MTTRRFDVVATMLALAAVEILLFAAVVMTAIGPLAGAASGTDAGSPAPEAPLPTQSSAIE